MLDCAVGTSGYWEGSMFADACATTEGNDYIEVNVRRRADATVTYVITSGLCAGLRLY